MMKRVIFLGGILLLSACAVDSTAPIARAGAPASATRTPKKKPLAPSDSARRFTTLEECRAVLVSSGRDSTCVDEDQ